MYTVLSAQDSNALKAKDYVTAGIPLANKNRTVSVLEMFGGGGGGGGGGI